ncbi:MAG: hypothetical protein Q7R70_04975 [Candidatus Diapherotrites archaeon]|nr:hypothetical protein [Candidatus Diapherotrites archaeon]
MDIGKTVNQTFSWLNLKSLKIILVWIVFSLVSFGLLFSLGLNFITELFALMTPQSISNPQLIIQVIINAAVQIFALILALGIISMLLSAYTISHALKSLGSKTSNFSIMKVIRIIAAILLIFLGLGIAFLIGIILVLILGALGLSAMLLAIVITIILIFASIALLYILVRLTVFEQVVIDSEAGVIESLKTSWDLTNGKFWQIVANALVAGIITLIAFFVISTIVQIATQPMISSALSPIIDEKVAQITPLLESLPKNPSLATGTYPGYIKTQVINGINGYFANSLVSFFSILCSAFLSASIYLQLKSEAPKKTKA